MRQTNLSLEEDGSSSSDSQGSEVEEGQITPPTGSQNSGVEPLTMQASHTHTKHTSEDLQDIDKEMQVRILELHHRMEEGGFHGAVNLMEQLFNNKPGQDRPEKKKLKEKIWSGMKIQSKGNSNQNSTARVTKLNILTDVTSFIHHNLIYSLTHPPNPLTSTVPSLGQCFGCRVNCVIN